ncbi:hypothetical protein IW261DRAFT_913684 [Armillaria novae-zelandiae]|uniref:Mid2 domain-containing protein n=1 Tax=Armillaria novae-zelandiae TaxID=153914 RepID=A0AA39TV48_9AGAR|nr:hypothetical protein IW261DRAFT_913684 [Armillaria novae-zelandiae]
MLLMILLCCIKFTLLNGFHFDEFSGTALSVGIPITLSWHFDTGDPDEVFFQRRHIIQQSFFQGDAIPTEITHPNGTLNVTFPSNGTFIVDAIASGTGSLNLLNSSGIFNFSGASEDSVSSDTTSSSSFSTSSSGEISQKPTTSAIPPSASSAHANRDRKTSIIIGAVIGSVALVLFLLGSATLILRRNYIRLKHSLLPNPKITFDRQSISLLSSLYPLTEKANGDVISPGILPSLTNDVDIQRLSSEEDLEELGEEVMERRHSRFGASTSIACLILRSLR